MIAPLTRIGLRTLILILSGMIGTYSVVASDERSLPSRTSSVRLSVLSYERIPIATMLTHPDRYQMRDIRIAGTVTAIQTEIITNRMICGSAHERTTLTVEDDSGQIEIIDRGGCGKNVGALKAPMLKVGQQIELLVQILLVKNVDQSEQSLEVAIRFLDLTQK